LAGPVVAAAVVLPEKFRHSRLNDSKQLAPELREEIYCELIASPELIGSTFCARATAPCAWRSKLYSNRPSMP
jgi:ribonuclease HII